MRLEDLHRGTFEDRWGLELFRQREQPGHKPFVRSCCGSETNVGHGLLFQPGPPLPLHRAAIPARPSHWLLRQKDPLSSLVRLRADHRCGRATGRQHIQRLARPPRVHASEEYWRGADWAHRASSPSQECRITAGPASCAGIFAPLTMRRAASNRWMILSDRYTAGSFQRLCFGEHTQARTAVLIRRGLWTDIFLRGGGILTRPRNPDIHMLWLEQQRRECGAAPRLEPGRQTERDFSIECHSQGAPQQTPKPGQQTQKPEEERQFDDDKLWEQGGAASR